MQIAAFGAKLIEARTRGAGGRVRHSQRHAVLYAQCPVPSAQCPVPVARCCLEQPRYFLDAQYIRHLAGTGRQDQLAQ